MDPKRLATGTVVGGVLMFAIGYLFWTVLFAGFFEAHGGSATGMDREAPIWWAAVVGTFLLAALLTHALDWSGASSMAEGFKTGAIVGLLLWGGVDFIFYGYFNFSDLIGTLADPALEIVRFGITGVVITAVGGMGGGATATE